MSGKEKHDEKKDGFMKIHKSYINYKKERFDVKNIYDLIKHEYKEKLINNELDFILERMYIKSKTGWDLDENTKVVVSSSLALITGIIIVFFQQDMKLGKNMTLDFLGFVVSIILVGSIFLFVNRKNFARDYNEKIYYKICLEVLDELEKENN